MIYIGWMENSEMKNEGFMERRDIVKCPPISRQHQVEAGVLEPVLRGLRELVG